MSDSPADLWRSLSHSYRAYRTGALKAVRSFVGALRSADGRPSLTMLRTWRALFFGELVFTVCVCVIECVCACGFRACRQCSSEVYRL